MPNEPSLFTTFDYRQDYLAREPRTAVLDVLTESTLCGKRKLRIIVPSFWKDHRKRLRTANDAFSSKIAWPKLASITDHAGSRCFRRRGNLQRDVYAQRPVCRRLLAKTSELGGRRCLRVHDDQFGPLPVGSLGRAADVPGRHCVPDHDEVYRDQSLWSAQLVASGTNQFSARPACGCRRDYGVGAVPDPVPPDASGTAITAFGSDCGRSMSFDPDATRLGRDHYLGSCDARIVVRCRSATALFALHHSDRIAFIPIAINFGLKPYQQQRITAFTHPDIDKQGSAWAVNQSLIAIGSGGWSGKGFKAPNTQIELGFLPATAVHNDYIFSAVAEQWGFIGGIVLIGAFALLLLTCLFVAFFAGDQLGLLLVVGVTALIFTHIFQNVGMTIAMLPITGVPLPLISYSGSFVLMIMFGLGLVNSVWIHRNVPA